ncbi:MAG: CHAT domain-containing protein [Caldilineaceae bacterium]|nr:CHAT domain-containing protein [Caldilineaceae bacterium]
MNARELADPQFILLHDHQTVAAAQAHLERMARQGITPVVIRQPHGQTTTYAVWSGAEAHVHLLLADADVPLSNLIREAARAAVLTPYADATHVRRAVVMEAGRLLGVICRTEPAGPRPDSAEPVIQNEDWRDWRDEPETMGLESLDGHAPEEAAYAEEPAPYPAMLPDASVPKGISPPPQAETTASETPSARALTASGLAQVELNQPASLLVQLLAAGQSPAGSLPVAVSPGERLDILARPQQGFILEGTDMATIIVAGMEETLPVLFKLRAAELGPGVVQLFAFRDGQPLGSMTYAAEITRDAAEKRSVSPVMDIPNVTPPAPDLSLLVLERSIDGETEITLRLTATDPDLGLNLKPFGPVRLRTAPAQYFQEFFRDIERLPVETEEAMRRAERRMATKGAQLFQTLFPEDLQALLWSLQDRIQAIQIQSEEPWIPWELCKLVGREDGRIVEGPFLCEAFAMTRWMPGIGQRPALTARRIGVIAPRDSGLAYAQNEFDYLMGLADDQRTVDDIPATQLDVTDAFAQGVYDVFHFTGHGVFRAPDPNHSGMELQDGEQLVPEDISGIAGNLGNATPLVFLNACQLGRSDLALTDIGGWAPQFLRAGAGAFIGAYWSVYDDSALAFAQSIYAELLSGSTVGQAAQAARRTARQSGDPSWLAYTVFAHPGAVIA